MSSVSFAKYDSVGNILYTGEVPDSMIELQKALGNIYVGDILSQDAQYIKDGKLHTYTSNELLAKLNLQPGWVWKMPERIALDTRGLEDAKTIARARVKAARSVAERSNFMYNGNMYQVDKLRIPSAVILALTAKLANQPYTTTWTTANNLPVLLDADGMIALGVAQGNHISNIFDTGRNLYTAIENAATKEEVDSINWLGD